ncbi:nuclear transport factor 2 family protein [Dyadobacter sp. CY261]|uniref:nuclear transport factor 2 family protein n=1 Tax=Dyadobacter sp. CY261 TaxID=2907203 RepID=UPI001F211485|nr:nuclear transport factor 2 family protein [Dyadobacter sp. CY261]MCF0070049.1 nuclear transport factor 2 family protein [Dyadobacter sp. CY261]
MNLKEQSAQSFARQWIDAWNSHDLAAIMSLYASEIRFYSPYIIKLGMNGEGVITDKAELEKYFSKALDIYTDLYFDLQEVLVGANSLILYYKSVSNRMAAELMELDEAGKIILVNAHYNH